MILALLVRFADPVVTIWKDPTGRTPAALGLAAAAYLPWYLAIRWYDRYEEVLALRRRTLEQVPLGHER